jgi:hypothetical protein
VLSRQVLNHLSHSTSPEEWLCVKGTLSAGLLAQVNNIRYSGGGDLEDQSSRPAWAKLHKNSSQPIKAECGGTHLSFQLPEKCQ